MTQQSYHRLKTTLFSDNFLIQKSTLAYTYKPQSPLLIKNESPRVSSEIGTKNYQDSLRRAFNRSKLLAFFNPDLTQFITFTYSDNMLDENQAMYDIKQFLKKQKRKSIKKQNINKKQTNEQEATSSNQKKTYKQPVSELSTYPQSEINQEITDTSIQKNELKNSRRRGCGHVDNYVNAVQNQSFDVNTGTNDFKYIYVFERQKRGAIHVHMICNDLFDYETINGHVNVKYWPHGFSEVLTIKDFDKDFKPYLYLFKYMHKAQRIGKSFVHVSRTFDKIIDVDYNDNILDLLIQGETIHEETTTFEFNQKQQVISKEYIRKKNY